MSPAPRQASIEELERQIGDLRTRLERLERAAGFEPGESPASGVHAAVAYHPLPGADTAGLARTTGKALLGLAAAYVLRALTEAGYFPLAAGVSVGVAYALGWLFLAARAGVGGKSIAAIRAITSTAILIPLLWEAQMRFHVVSPWVTAAVLVLFSVFGLGVSWRNNVSAVAWVATLAGAITMFVLLIATRQLAPFTWALLALAAAVEASACWQHWLRERWVVAFLANFSVLLMTYLVTQRGGLPEAYTPVPRGAVVAALAALFLVYMSSAVIRTLGRGFRVHWFEIAQAAFVTVILGVGVLSAAQWTFGSSMIVSTAAILCAAASYGVFLSGRLHDSRSAYAYSLFALALTVAAVPLLAGPKTGVLIWCTLGVLFTWFGRRSSNGTLAFHGGIYIIAGAFWTGTLAAAVRAFVGPVTHTRPGVWGAVTIAVVVAALLSYVVLTSATLTSNWARRLIILVLAATGCLGATVLVSEALLTRCPANTATGSGHYCATFSTVVIVASICLLAWISSRHERRELAWVSFLLLGLAAVKLLVQDIRAGSTAAIVVSLFCYGACLLWLPRLIKTPAATPAR